MNGNIECALIGRVIERPELKTSAAGKPWAAFRVAVGDGESAQYARVAMFGDLAEQIARTVEKGSKLYIEGTIRLDRWKNANGEERSGLSVAAWKCERVGAGAIGKNKPLKPKTAPEVDSPASTHSAAARTNGSIDDAIPF